MSESESELRREAERALALGGFMVAEEQAIRRFISHLDKKIANLELELGHRVTLAAYEQAKAEQERAFEAGRQVYSADEGTCSWKYGTFQDWQAAQKQDEQGKAEGGREG